MSKRDVVLKAMGQIAAWGDDNDIAMSAWDEVELAERIYNMLVAEGYLLPGEEANARDTKGDRDG